ncbi:MAG: M48 family metallopeptidase [Paracoccaceae bacterium]|nr:M48 family metallopeptidase [Paracoccaceae bacterium]
MTRIGLLLLALALVFAWIRFVAWQSGRQLRQRSRPLANDQIEALLARLARTAGIDRIAVRVLDMPIVNGLATPSGEIYITSGLFKKFQTGRITAPELASVVAHELGHLALGHTKRRIMDVTGAQIVHLVLGSILNWFLPFIGWIVARWVATFVATRLSRKDEFEADAYATALMVRSGLGAEPQARMLEKLLELVPEAAAHEMNWLSSHPPVAERTGVIRANAERWTEEGAPEGS